MGWWSSLFHTTAPCSVKLLLSLQYTRGPGDRAIIGDEDSKRAPFLGLSLWYGTIFLFLEQIAPSPASHARTCCEDFRRSRAGEMASENPEIVYAVAHNSTPLWQLEFCLQSKRLKRSCQGWMNQFIIADFISSLVSIVRSSCEEQIIQSKTRLNTRILIGLMNNKLVPYLDD